MAEEEQKISKYNSGINIIMRLDVLWKDTHHFSRVGDYEKWNDTLDRVWVELARDLNDKEYTEKKKDFDEFNIELSQFGNLRKPDTKGFNNTKEAREKAEENKTNYGKQYKKILDKELFLRRLENHLGKGTAWDEDDEDGFD